MVKIYDCFPFFNELELLEIRLNELYNFVDYFVICESTVTHSGKPKPLYYEKNKERFKRWQDKIIHLVYKPKKSDMVFRFFDWISHFKFMKNNTAGRIYSMFGLGRWRIESGQRDYLLNGLKNAKDEDIIFLSDVDEIWNSDLIKKLNKNLLNNEVVYLKQSMFYYYLNGKAKQIWDAANIVRYKKLKEIKSIDKVRNWKISQKVIGALFKIYPAKKKENIWENAGWHFSYLGGLKKIKEKIESTSHFENDFNSMKSNKSIINKINKGIFWAGNGIRLEYVKIDKSFPKTIQKNTKKYAHLIKKAKH